MEQQLDILNGPAVEMQPPAGKRRAGRSGRDDVVATRVHPDIKRRFIEEAKKRDWSPGKLLALALTEWIAGQSDTRPPPPAVSLPVTAPAPATADEAETAIEIDGYMQPAVYRVVYNFIPPEDAEQALQGHEARKTAAPAADWKKEAHRAMRASYGLTPDGQETEARKTEPPADIDEQALRWLTTNTSGDKNDWHLKRANKETLQAAIRKLEGQPNVKTALKRLKGRLNAIEREERRSLGIAAQVRQHHV